ncbi:ribosome-associated protein [Pseudoalteromonas aurantia]|uniref:Ribosome-associated protein n=1 Tax=Pseudoalteromonas aurantia TaxID=43654 RepID=A0A5S3VCT7_9GAMM|nr:RNA-binding S4 domain-containing protein [Pseudoalteromonas aurantia]TMO66775.1 ribosome-associated protein [Pseudoalteromonas aurantia]TMO69738.1 ribosome-associated protein [Pseudoalteromonas aurantia]
MSNEPIDYIEVELEEEPIELCNLLKVLDLVETGGQAKMLIGEGYIAVNDAICTVKRKKMYSGDNLHFDGDDYLLTLSPDAIPVQRTESTPEPTEPEKKKKRNRNRKNRKDADTGRKPISFG